MAAVIASASALPLGNTSTALASTSSTHNHPRHPRPIPHRNELSKSRERCAPSTSSKRQIEYGKARGLGSKKGSSAKFELDDDNVDDADAGAEEESISDDSGSSGTGQDALDAGGVKPIRPGTSPYEVPILDLVVSRRRGKDKVMMDEWDMISKPGSRAIIELDDEDQEFLDGWAPDFYVENESEWRHPLYSDVLKAALEKEEPKKQVENESSDLEARGEVPSAEK